MPASGALLGTAAEEELAPSEGRGSGLPAASWEQHLTRVTVRWQLLPKSRHIPQNQAAGGWEGREVWYPTTEAGYRIPKNPTGTCPGPWRLEETLTNEQAD